MDLDATTVDAEDEDGDDATITNGAVFHLRNLLLAW